METEKLENAIASPKTYTQEELEQKRKEDKRKAEIARRERDKYYSFYDDVKTPDKPSW